MRTGNHEIQDYKGQTIYYDEDDDKFICNISIEDNFKTTKRKSLKDVRKEIDAFIKENLNFKPFKAIEIPTSSYDYVVNSVEIIAIRTDKKLVIKGKFSNEHYGKKEAQNLRIYDSNIIEEQIAIEKEYEEAGKKRMEALKKLRAKLKQIDLSKYDLA